MNRVITLTLAIALGAFASHTVRAAPAVDDVQLHGLAGGVIAITATGLTQSAWQGFAYGCGANVLKEVLDHAGMGVADPKDLIAGCAGAALGATSGRFLVRRIRGGAEVIFRTEF
jgi:hypothetical protein